MKQGEGYIWGLEESVRKKWRNNYKQNTFYTIMNFSKDKMTSGYLDLICGSKQ